MKKQALRIFTTVAFFAVLAAAPAYAQSGSRIVGRATIPFDFVIKNEKAASGQYTVERINSSSGTTVLLLRSADGRGIEMFMPMTVQAGESVDRGKLVFHRYGDQYFLYQIWQSGDQLGHELPKSRRERVLRQEVARAMSQHQKVTIALNR
ncbi:MAG: hypothetical protein H0T92_24105 [Pyrinomonadaceae bacterium]|nr:hypothetical protein [Pyrinomonadaceae bacterium]